MTTDRSFLDAFSLAFPDAGPPRTCRAPGRINLIGEHTDYNGLPVLPMAIDREFRIAFAPLKGGQVRLQNVDTAYPPAEFRNASEIPPSATGSWDNYCKAAVHALNQHFAVSEFPGMALMVSGSIPPAAGLSSSSALVVASALAYLGVLDKQLGQDITRIALATLLANAEHYVGTRGGGMDQAIILLAASSQATKIDFFPIRTEQVPLPDGYAIVACNSLVKAAKTGDALHRYNEGPLTCRLIRALVEKQIQEDFGDDVHIERLGDLWLGNLCLTHSEVDDLFAKTFPNETTTLAQAASALQMTPQEIRKRWLGDLLEPKDGFRLQARARHQGSEYQRVEAARDALLLGDATELGRLMNASHESCAQDYAISCPELDQLVAVARDAGALGARLTGAGFGGCTVNLVPVSKLSSFRERVTAGYYALRPETGSSRLPEDPIVTMAPSPGASYIA
jgi:N-acetylgalactosamine kinase